MNRRRIDIADLLNNGNLNRQPVEPPQQRRRIHVQDIFNMGHQLLNIVEVAATPFAGQERVAVEVTLVPANVPQNEYFIQLWTFFEQFKRNYNRAYMSWQFRERFLSIPVNSTFEDFLERLDAMFQSNEEANLFELTFHFTGVNIRAVGYQSILPIDSLDFEKRIPKGLTLVNGTEDKLCLVFCILEKILMDPDSCMILCGTRSFNQSNGNRLAASVDKIQNGYIDNHPKYREVVQKYKEKIPSSPSIDESYLCQVLDVFPRLQIMIFFHCGGQPRGAQGRLTPTNLNAAKKLSVSVYYAHHANAVGHVDKINNFKEFMRGPRRTVCFGCLKVYPRQKHLVQDNLSYIPPNGFFETHECRRNKMCTGCLREESLCPPGEKQKCLECDVECQSLNCLSYHQTSLAHKKVKKHCDVCNANYHGHSHICGVIFCKICGMQRSSGGHTHIFQQLKYKKKNDYVLACLDIEVMQVADGTRKMMGADGFMEVLQLKHVINFIHLDLDGQLHDFTSARELFTFFKNLQIPSKIYVFAHNMGKYDGKLLFDAFHELYPREVPTVKWMGQKLMYFGFKVKLPDHRDPRLTEYAGPEGETLINDCDIILRDSLYHITQPLASFPKTFGLNQDEFKKGFFPHTFNIPENQNYIGPYPEKKFYQPEKMKPSAFQEFELWYETVKYQEYDFQKELKEYCRDDVKVLKKGLEVYRENALKSGEVDPLGCMTIASYCLKVCFIFNDRCIKKNIMIQKSFPYLIWKNLNEILYVNLFMGEERMYVNKSVKMKN